MKPAIQDAAKALFDTIFEHEQCWGGPGDAVEIAMTAIADHYANVCRESDIKFLGVFGLRLRTEAHCPAGLDRAGPLPPGYSVPWGKRKAPIGARQVGHSNRKRPLACHG
jgi:hypothetical protein